MNRHLSKPSNSDEFLEANGTQNRSVLDVRDDLSTGATQKLPEERRFRKRSNIFLNLDNL
ncbi:MAG: palindromic element RPE1 domain-containing protein [Holosporaceae bacterium]|jgi:RPE1 domain-containing protein|nr:palindromic element RPE1 domain-containing protein [Holosporaceae bacterium]